MTPPYVPEGEKGHEIAAMISAIDPLREGFPDLFMAFDTVGPEVCLVDGAVEVRGYLDSESGRIVISADTERDGRVVILLHEMRHLLQRERGYCPSNEVSMEEAARAVLAYEADAMASTTAAAWELHAMGMPGPWNWLSVEWTRYSDIADAYAKVRTGGDQRVAMEAAFAAWYGSDWRVHRYWRASSMDYLDREEAGHLLRSYDSLPEDHFANLCTMPDGSAYTCDVPPPPDR